MICLTNNNQPQYHIKSIQLTILRKITDNQQYYIITIIFTIIANITDQTKPRSVSSVIKFAPNEMVAISNVIYIARYKHSTQLYCKIKSTLYIALTK